MKVAVNGKRLFFDTSGSVLTAGESGLVEKPTLILLHGAPGNSDHTVFKPMFEELADVAQVIYLDLAGCGRSDDPVDGSFSLESWADDLVGFCDALGIERPIVLGNSAGGMVAAVYGIRHPNHPGKLILSSTQAKLRAERCLAVFERIGGPEVRAVAERALVTHGDFDSLMAYRDRCMPLYNPTPQKPKRHSIFRLECADTFHRLGGIWHQLNFLDDLSKISCPTLVMAGEEDPVTPIADAEDIAGQINPALLRFERFANAGHGVWLDRHAEAFAVIRSFIAS